MLYCRLSFLFQTRGLHISDGGLLPIGRRGASALVMNVKVDNEIIATGLGWLLHLGLEKVDWQQLVIPENNTN